MIGMSDLEKDLPDDMDVEEADSWGETSAEDDVLSDEDDADDE